MTCDPVIANSPITAKCLYRLIGKTGYVLPARLLRLTAADEIKSVSVNSSSLIAPSLTSPVSIFGETGRTNLGFVDMSGAGGSMSLSDIAEE